MWLKDQLSTKTLIALAEFSIFISNIVIRSIDKYNPLQSFLIKITLFIVYAYDFLSL